MSEEESSNSRPVPIKYGISPPDLKLSREREKRNFKTGNR
jgi:hypothetical protein